MKRVSRKSHNKLASKSKKKTQKGGKNDTNLFLKTNRLTTGPIENGEVLGILHVTEAAGINALRGIGTGVANLFGEKGFDYTIYSNVKNKAFKKLFSKLKDGQKIGNIKMDIETTRATIFCHLLGTVYQMK